MSLSQRREERREQFLYRVGNLVETAIGDRIEHTKLEAPVLTGDPEEKIWYRVPVEEGISGDGSGYHIYIKKGSTDHLCVFLSGGGVAWNEYTASHPVTGGKVAAGMPNYYWNNLRPFTQMMNIGVGITANLSRNPFADWNFIIITYATGDFHVGDGDFLYRDEDGSDQILHFRGHSNFRAGMDLGKSLFPSCDKLLIAGNSAGAFAVPALTSEIIEDYYPDCGDVTLFSDSGQLLKKDWRETAQNIWKSDAKFYEPITSDNITLDWYKALVSRYGDRFRYLYASSTRDYLLSAYYNDVVSKTFETSEEMQEIYYRQLITMTKQLRELIPDISFFINDWPQPLSSKGGTIHTAVREPSFYLKNKNGISMADWLRDAVEGHPYDVGTELLIPSL